MPHATKYEEQPPTETVVRRRPFFSSSSLSAKTTTKVFEAIFRNIAYGKVWLVAYPPETERASDPFMRPPPRSYKLKSSDESWRSATRSGCFPRAIRRGAITSKGQAGARSCFDKVRLLEKKRTETRFIYIERLARLDSWISYSLPVPFDPYFPLLDFLLRIVSQVRDLSVLDIFDPSRP